MAINNIQIPGKKGSFTIEYENKREFYSEIQCEKPTESKLRAFDSNVNPFSFPFSADPHPHENLPLAFTQLKSLLNISHSFSMRYKT